MLGEDDGLKLGLEFQAEAPATQIIIMTGGGLGLEEVAVCDERARLWIRIVERFVASSVTRESRAEANRGTNRKEMRCFARNI